MDGREGDGALDERTMGLAISELALRHQQKPQASKGVARSG